MVQMSVQASRKYNGADVSLGKTQVQWCRCQFRQVASTMVQMTDQASRKYNGVDDRLGKSQVQWCR